MKTIEEKAKAYDEKLKIAKQLLETSVAYDRFTIEKIFSESELKENSEDEQSKKWILDYLYDGLRKSDEQFKGQFNAAITWLKKQDEKSCNVSSIDNFETEFEKQVSYLIASSINKEYEYISDYVKWVANSLLNYAKKELEKKKRKC